MKVVAWYDNEWGYSNRLVELAAKVAAGPPALVGSTVSSREVVRRMSTALETGDMLVVTLPVPTTDAQRAERVDRRDTSSTSSARVGSAGR